MKHDRRGSWYLLTALVLGAGMGLLYSWVISPVKYVNAPPYALRADYKDAYRALVASAYLYSGDLVRAQARLAQLKDDESAQSLARQAQQAQAARGSEQEVKALSLLALALGKGVTPMPASPSFIPSVSSTPTASGNTSTPVVIEPSISPTVTVGLTDMLIGMLPTPIPSSTFGPSPTPTPTATQGAPFALQEMRLVCNTGQLEPLIQVEILDAAGQPVPSLELVITWDGGEDHFFTGLQPEVGLGYGDFLMQPGTVYSIRLAQGGQPVDELTAAECVSADNSRYWGSWFLTFVQP